MHPHLHTKDNIGCEEVVVAFEECHAKGFLWKSMGMCNDLKTQLGECLKEERKKRQDDNRQRGNDRKAKMRAALKEIKENS